MRFWRRASGNCALISRVTTRPMSLWPRRSDFPSSRWISVFIEFPVSPARWILRRDRRNRLSRPASRYERRWATARGGRRPLGAFGLGVHGSGSVVVARRRTRITWFGGARPAPPRPASRVVAEILFGLGTIQRPAPTTVSRCFKAWASSRRNDAAREACWGARTSTRCRGARVKSCYRG